MPNQNRGGCDNDGHGPEGSFLRDGKTGKAAGVEEVVEEVRGGCGGGKRR